MTADTTPRVFLSYSHDSQAHKAWVLDFASRLRGAGIDAVLDLWELGPGDDIPAFMERNLETADRVLMICTPNYVKKANSGSGGVGYEKMIITAELMRNIDSNKVIPIIRQQGTLDTPTFLKTKLFIDFSPDDQFEIKFDELSRAVHGAPLFTKPNVGTNPFATTATATQLQSKDFVRDLMRSINTEYELTTHKYCTYRAVLDRALMSRVLFDYAIDQACEQALISVDDDGDIWLEPEGRRYLVTNVLR